MTASLPQNPSLENLKKQAKTLKKAWLAGNQNALQRIHATHPRNDAPPRLTDCQLVLARELGFASWPQLRVAVLSANQHLPDQFITLACLCYDDPHYDHRSFHLRAHEVLQRNPWLAGANIWSAAAVGNATAIKAFLDENPDSVNHPGPHGWSPLICTCYSRVLPVDPTHSTFESAKLLLDRGADPNSYTLKGNADERLDQSARRFTALTGLFGGGSTGLANQPPHKYWRELAELLLERGADPADEQSLSINQTASLPLLVRHGLKAEAQITTESGTITLLGRELSRAARNGRVNLVKLLLANGANTSERLDGHTPWEHATSRGHLDIARILERAGAPAIKLDDVGQFVSFCLAGDERGARAMLEQAPELMAQAPRNMVQRAVGTDKSEAVQLVLDLGFDPNVIDDNAAIHQAGELARNEDILRLLLQHGASLTLRDPWYDSTAIGWADFFDYGPLRDRLLNESGICLFDALDFDRLDRVPDILARDPAALERPFANCLTREPKPEDWQTPLARMLERGKSEAALILLQHGASTRGLPSTNQSDPERTR
ncbi:MAG TPA: ankyrin repeat domain-containing protein [Bryobacteraceae bacterium]|nr:ankyrin repeat domain-containing protein [Bryobacteraceae bacterium]